MKLPGQRVLVTGAGHGLGRALALEFAGAGAAVVATDLDPGRAEAVAAEVRRLGRAAAGYPLDVTAPEQVMAVRDRVRAEQGPVGVPLDRHLATVDVNLSGVLAVTHAFLPDLLERPAGQVVNIASASAVVPLPLAASYAASKWAVLGFSDSLREELRRAGRRHVRVTAVCPSLISTGLFAGARPARLTGMLTPEGVARAVRRAVEQGSEFVMLPRSARLLYSVAGVLPRPVYARVCRWLGVADSMAGWKGHPAAPP
jgi:short-subunit dehydrogenase